MFEIIFLNKLSINRNNDRQTHLVYRSLFAISIQM
jgi:hypothetical protein